MYLYESFSRRSDFSNQAMKLKNVILNHPVRRWLTTYLSNNKYLTFFTFLTKEYKIKEL